MKILKCITFLFLSPFPFTCCCNILIDNVTLMAAATPNRTVLFVSGLHEQVNPEILYAAFLPFGDISEVSIPPEAPSQSYDDYEDYRLYLASQGQFNSKALPPPPNAPLKHRGFGFVEFVEPEDARAAIDNMHHAELFGKTIRVSLAKPNTNIWRFGNNLLPNQESGFISAGTQPRASMSCLAWWPYFLTGGSLDPGGLVG